MVINNVTAVAKAAKAYGIPTILTTVLSAMSAREPREDLFAFWKRVFDSAVTKGARGGYDDEMYYRALAFRSPEAARQIKHFVEDGIASPAETLRTALAENGVGVAYNDATATESYLTLAAIRTGEIVTTGDGCEQLFAARQSRGSVYIEASGCRTFAKKIFLAAVGGVPLAQDPLSAWEMLSSICSKNEQINVMLETEHVDRSVACPRSVSKRARYLQITHAPFDGVR